MPGLIAPFASKPAAQAAHFESDAVKMSRAGGCSSLFSPFAPFRCRQVN